MCGFGVSADGRVNFLDAGHGVSIIDDAAAELLSAEVKEHCIRTVGFADLEAAFANIIREELTCTGSGREDQHSAAGSFWFRCGCAGVWRQRRGGLREPQDLRLMMSAVRELVHDVLDLRAGGRDGGRERQESVHQACGDPA